MQISYEMVSNAHVRQLTVCLLKIEVKTMERPTLGGTLITGHLKRVAVTVIGFNCVICWVIFFHFFPCRY